MAKRYKIRFSDQESYLAAQSIATTASNVIRPRGLSEFGQSLVQVKNDKRHYLSVEPSTQLSESIGERKLEEQLESFDKRFGARIVEDYRYDLETNIFDPYQFGPDDPSSPSLDDVLAMIKAPEAWAEGTGKGITIAVVDTGIDGTRPEFPKFKRAGQWQPLPDRPWTDSNGHGTMCATIAAGTNINGGAFSGVAPDASLIACKTGFYDSELAAIYDYLTDLVNSQQLNIVATNSFGIQTGSPPPVPSDSDFIPALNDALASGIKTFFSAGNYHEFAGGGPHDCHPTTIWLHKSRSDVMTIATCDMNLEMWRYSSRGPGQHFGDDNTNSKPDVTAPTPANGRVVYGNTIRALPNGWGTSGACPQVAGLAALLLSKQPDLSRDDLFDIIRRTATPLPHKPTCCGYGVINCKAAIDAI